MKNCFVQYVNVQCIVFKSSRMWKQKQQAQMILSQSKKQRKPRRNPLANKK